MWTENRAIKIVHLPGNFRGLVLENLGTASLAQRESMQDVNCPSLSSINPVLLFTDLDLFLVMCLTCMGTRNTKNLCLDVMWSFLYLVGFVLLWDGKTKLGMNELCTGCSSFTVNQRKPTIPPFHFLQTQPVYLQEIPDPCPQSPRSWRGFRGRFCGSRNAAHKTLTFLWLH